MGSTQQTMEYLTKEGLTYYVGGLSTQGVNYYGQKCQIATLENYSTLSGEAMKQNPQ